MPPKVHPCPECGRVLHRAEHLRRHLRTRTYGADLHSTERWRVGRYSIVDTRWCVCIDTKERPYACRCGQAFTRQDLLVRHRRLAHASADREASADDVGSEFAPSAHVPSNDNPEWCTVTANEHERATPPYLSERPGHTFDATPSMPAEQDFDASMVDFSSFMDVVGLDFQLDHTGVNLNPSVDETILPTIMPTDTRAYGPTPVNSEPAQIVTIDANQTEGIQPCTALDIHHDHS